jgi:alpha-methylacyl-CoA racemase
VVSPSNHEPQLPGPLVGDIGAAMQATVGILAALLQRARTGIGSIVDVSIHDAAMAWAMFPTTEELANACYNVYETADGRWLALGALEPKFWKGFCDRIGRPDLVPLQQAQGEERARVLKEVRDVMRGQTRDEWLSAFADADVCLTPIYTPEEVAGDPHVVARGAASTVRLAARRSSAHNDRSGGGKPDTTYESNAPPLGADTDAVLEAAGIDAAERARLRAKGVL